MTDALDVLVVATATVLATGLGALPVIASGAAAERLRPWLDGLVIGVMGVAAVVGLLRPAFQTGSPPAIAVGIALGAGGLWWARRALRHHVPGEGDAPEAERTALLAFGVLFVHSLPEGLALGSALAAQGSVATLVAVAIAIQNIPEGTVTAIALRRAGRSPAVQLGAATLTSVPQIPGALLAWLAVDLVAAILPASLAAAGAAMLLLVCVDLVPQGAHASSPARVVGGAVAGAAAMIALAVALGGT